VADHPLPPGGTAATEAGEAAAPCGSVPEPTAAHVRRLEARVAELERALSLRASQTTAGDERLVRERVGIMESVPDGLVMAAPSGQVIYHNRVSLDLHGYANLQEASQSRQQIQEQWELLDMDGHPVPVADWPMPRALRGEVFDGYELHVRRRDGRRDFIASYGGSLVRSAAGEPLFALLVVRDISARKAAERALRASELRYRTLVEATGAITWSCPPSGLAQAAQPEWLAFTGQTAKAMLGTGWADAVHPDDAARVAQRWQDAVARGEPMVSEYRVRRHDGAWRWVSVHAAPIRDARGEVTEWIGMHLDISARKQAEAAALAAREQARLRLAELEDLYRNAPVGLCLLDRDLRFVRINERLAEINGIPAAEHIGKTVRELTPRLAEVAEAILRDVLDTGQPRLDVEIVGETPSRPGVERSFVEHWLPVKDAEGRITGVSVVAEETTARKQAEMALRESARRKDEFLAILAHELRNPLAALRTGLDLIEALRGEDSACERPVQMMDRQLNLLVRLVDDLLDVARISRGTIQLRMERLDLAEVIRAALEISGSGLSRGARRLSVDLPSGPLPVQGDRIRLVQVLCNLLNNAAKFTDDHGRIAVTAERAGDSVHIRVQDDGRGIPRERLAEVFEMFSQAEPGRDGGLGIGLTLVRSLVALHGGSVRAESDGPGRGAVFTVSLPLCGDGSTQHAPQDAPAAERTPQRRVLVVDDNPDIAESLGLLLTTLNAEVRIAHDGAEAIRICEDWLPTHVLMDLGMPGMDGYETARRLRARHGKDAFRLVAISGWGQDEHRQKTRQAGFDQHFVKPVGVAAIKALLAD
jgi:PAS domain S-box-containing protein